VCDASNLTISFAQHLPKSRVVEESDTSANAQVELLNRGHENQHPFYFKEVQAFTSCFLFGKRIPTVKMAAQSNTGLESESCGLD
jgi:hypothetical protein